MKRLRRKQRQEIKADSDRARKVDVVRGRVWAAVKQYEEDENMASGDLVSTIVRITKDFL